MTIDITLACHEYAWTRPLWEGRVEPEGMNLTTVDYRNPVRFSRMVRNLEFDACELSMGTYLASRRDTDEFPFTAIPVFPFRKFRHSYMYNGSHVDLESVKDLEGRRVGIVNWQTTTGVWQRGILGEHHDLDLTAVEWVACGSEIIDIDIPDAFDVEYLEKVATIDLLEELLADEKIDAIFHPVDAGMESAERLFSDVRAVEQEYYEQTSIFPIMHAVVIRDSLLEEHPWLVQPFYDAFERAKEIGLEILQRPREIPLAWADIYQDEQQEIMGEDPWEYGLTEKNMKTLRTLIRYAHNQGLAAEQYDVEDLFATETLGTPFFG